jgi:hypothetical protein
MTDTSIPKANLFEDNVQNSSALRAMDKESEGHQHLPVLLGPVLEPLPSGR